VTDTDVHVCLFILWSITYEIPLPCCVYAGSSMKFQCFEIQIKTEADSNDITLCSDDDKPTTGMFTVSDKPSPGMFTLSMNLRSGVKYVIY